MEKRTKQRRRVFVLAVLLLGVAAASSVLTGGQGRDFAGVYATSNEMEFGEDVSMTFEVEIANHSGADLLGAAVQLDNPLDPENPLATWASVEVAHKGRCGLIAEVSVPVHERDSWRKGRMPQLSVEYQNADGITFRRPVELIRGTVILERGQP